MSPKIHPGRILKKELEARAITQRAFSKLIKKSEVEISDIIAGRRKITADLAMRFEAALDTPADSWLTMQQQYDLAAFRNSKDKLKIFTAIRELAQV